MSAMKVHFQIAKCSPLYQKKKDGLILEKYIIIYDIKMDNRKVALITGITGQDDSYLAEYLEKGIVK